MKILFVLSEIKYSGAAKIASWLANKLSESGYDVTFLTFIEGEDKRKLNEEIIRIRICGGISNRYLRTILVIREIHKMLKKEQYDALISFLPLEGMVSVVAGFFTPTKIIVSERSDPYHEKSSMSNFFRFMFRFADGAVFQSEGAMNYYPPKLRSKSEIIANPVISYSQKFIPYAERKNIIVSSSRLEIRQKRQDVLLKAFKSVSLMNPSIILQFIGDGPDEEKLKKIADELNISEKVDFLGKKENVLEIIRKAKVFAFSSDYEGMPNSVLEALSIGVPVVTTDYCPGGARNIIENHQRGFVVPLGNASLLAEKINLILNDTNLGENMARNAISVCDEFSEISILDKWMKYIEKIVIKI